MKKVLILIALVALSMPMLADEVYFQTATTMGCFYTGSTACTPSSGSATFEGLSFIGADLPVTSTTGGSLDFLLGSFIFAGDPYNFGANKVNFSAAIEFTNPQTIASGNPADYFANITGQVNSQGNGTLTINFDNSPLTIYFSNSAYSGSFQFSVTDAKLNVNSPVAPNDGNWDGQITNALQSSVRASSDLSPVPEPASLFLLGAGLVGVGGLLRDRLK